MDDSRNIKPVVFVCNFCKLPKPIGYALVKCENCGCVEVTELLPFPKDARRTFAVDNRRTERL